MYVLHYWIEAASLYGMIPGWLGGEAEGFWFGHEGARRGRRGWSRVVTKWVVEGWCSRRGGEGRRKWWNGGLIGKSEL